MKHFLIQGIRILLLYGILSAGLTPVNYGQSNSDSLKTIHLGEVVVTATRTMRNPSEIPARISVVGTELIEATPAQQTDDILRFVPGVNVNRSAGIYSQRPAVTLRGLSGDEQSRTLVLMNGIPINTSDEGGVNWNRINQFDLERIEIFKGPGSTLYGNNAMGGVINLISRRPTGPGEISGTVSYGTFNTVRQDLNIRMRSDEGLYGIISQYFLKSDGYNNVPEDRRTPYDIARSLEEIGVSARIGFDRGAWLNWELQYDIFRDTRGEGYQILAPLGCYRNFNTDLIRGSLQGGDENTHYNLNLYYQLEHYYDVNERLKGSNYSRYDVNSQRRDLGMIFSISSDLLKHNTFTGGFELKKGSIDGGDYYQTEPYDTVHNSGTLRTLSCYVQDEHAFSDNKIRLIAGIRFDLVSFYDGNYHATNAWSAIPELNDHTWSELSPRAGLRFNFIPEVSAYISYSHGFRASILDDLTRTGWMWVGPKYANPELGPESLDNYELGLDLSPFGKLKISASAYYALGNDFLYYVATSDSLFGRPVYRRENVSDAILKGIETEINYEPAPGLVLTAGYTHADSKIDGFTERPELEGNYLKYVPRHTAAASVFWKNGIVNASIRGLYKGAQFADDANTVELDPYFTCDLQISKQIMERYRFSIDVQDLFDGEHIETADYISPGRIISGRISLKF
ncbi:MAG: TonB-dependent receptor [Cytophagales bacterium]|nr:TonB-dependent receptor [Cytophagales bacterium]